MSKALMISIRQEHAFKILTGKKTLEIRTWIPKGYVGWVYVYVTKGKPYLVKFYNDYPIQKINDYTYQELLDDGNVPMNGKVAFRFWFDDYEYFDEFYAWHINDLEIFDKPKELIEFYKWVRKTIYSDMDCPPYVDDVLVQLTRAPRKMQWVYVKELEK